MKVWLMADVLLLKNQGVEYRPFDPFDNPPGSAKTVPAGSCMIVCNDQTQARHGELAIYGNGCCDIVNVQWLSFEPLSTKAT